MLEIRPPAPCADRVRAPSRSRSHSWLCSVQCAAPAARDRVTAPGSASLRTAGSRHSSATDVESYSCTNTSATSVESYSWKKGGGAPPPNRATPLFRAANLSKIGVAARRFAARPRSEPGGIWTRAAGSQSPLESALTPKHGWGVPPPGRFVR
jgi:hypothetical protein